MNNRLIQILQYLSLLSEPVTSNELAAKFQVSTKTIQNDIKAINQRLKQHGASVESMRGIGYSLRVDQRDRFLEFLRQQEQAIHESDLAEKDGRIRRLMEKLLLNTEYMKIDDLADELNWSRSTLQGDLKEVREILRQYGLTLEQKPGYGIKVAGDEMRIRFCISEYVFNQKRQILEEPYEWSSILPKEELEIIKNSLLKQIRKNRMSISDISVHNLVTHIAIACKRIRDENIIMNPSLNLEELENKMEFRVARDIVSDIEKQLEVKFPANEIGYIAIHLLGTKLVNRKWENGNISSFIEPDILALAKKMVARIDEQYHFQLKNDEELLTNLCLHLQPAINRYHYHMNLRNPLLSEIKSKYTLSFEAALTGAEVLKSEYGIQIDENEIGYIALHIELALERQKKKKEKVPRCIIVCASGEGTAQLLYYKLKNTFGDKLDIVGTSEYYNLQNLDFSDIDFIISTVPIYEKDIPVPVVLVNAIFGEADLKKIEKAISKESVNIDRYLREKYTFLRKDFLTMEEVIHFLGSQLIRDGLVPEEYIEAVFKRERVMPTSYGNFVAIPHPLEPYTEETFWSIVTLKKPIPWGENPVQFVLLLNISKGRKQDLKPMYQVLIRLLDNTGLIQQLVQCESFAEFADILKKWNREA